ncbi:hypothetical protein PV768_16735 [Pseudarthrobacter sp. CC4]|uniref:hypothetical protein n=1 Tax=Pseudarthrobacter TaxID=1742993 RepID=UPI002AA8E81A|nr:hypothetical protein [Pseudarthrobacter oxydans]WPU07781.1 hypothetical protein SMD14_11305 [Pseudarthrobacter oxydans]
MGFWHTGYLEFHEPTEEGTGTVAEPLPATFPCATCGVDFFTDRDLRVHAFEGHPTRRPVLVLKGRECGRTRLTLTSATSPEDWVIRNTDAVAINGTGTSIANAVEFLAAQRGGVVDVTLTKSDVVQAFQFEFALADVDHLESVDDALKRLIDGGELSLRAIDDFIMRSKGYLSAGRYLYGLANYLYGVLAREGLAESGVRDDLQDGGGYQGKYDQAVGILGTFDRPAAEAICGIVAFHYNHFERAMTKTKSQRVAEVSLRFQSLLKRETYFVGDLAPSPHASLDVALSDSVIEQVLGWSALPLDGTAAAEIAELSASIHQQRPYDAFKLHLVAAEHALAEGDIATAGQHAERLRYSRLAEGWYAGFRTRVQGV